MFVGREFETHYIMKELCRGKNIIVGGKFGIGRTSLIKKISETMADKTKFIFIDFNQTPGKMSEKLMRELGLSRRLKKTGRIMGYKSMRYRIATAEPSAKKDKPVIVLDNVAKLTPQKIIFLRNLLEENHFQFVAIVENFLPPEDFARLRALFYPAEIVALNYLRPEEVFSLIRLYSDQHHFHWPDHYIRELVSIAGRYPLGIIEMLKKQAAERSFK